MSASARRLESVRPVPSPVVVRCCIYAILQFGSGGDESADCKIKATFPYFYFQVHCKVAIHEFVVVRRLQISFRWSFIPELYRGSDRSSFWALFKMKFTRSLFNSSRYAMGSRMPADVRPTHIIVGGGSAGCVLANRLSEDQENRVLLIEAGPKDHWWDWKIHMPAALMYNLKNDRYNWYYHTQPEKGMNDRMMYWPRGRVLGGSSALNAMCYVRGHAFDYDRWAKKEGCPNWSYADCLPYFKKSETYDGPIDGYRGDSGPLHVHRFRPTNPLFQAFIEAGVQAGYGQTEDMNGYKQEGFGVMDATIYKGVRWSTSRAYLRPILGKRKNLYVETNQQVQRILFGKKMDAVAVELGNRSNYPNSTKIYAEKEIILCGGAINTPHILNLSGVGNAEDLGNVGIRTLHHLPGIGQNLQDHLELYVQRACTKPVTLYGRSSWKFPLSMIQIGLEWFISQTGLGASAHLEAGAFIRSRDQVEHPDIQFHFLPSVVLDHGRKDPTQHAFQVHVGPMRPTSRGAMFTASTHPYVHPYIFARYMTTEQDRREMRDCVRAARRVFSQSAFDEFRGEELAPGLDVQSDSQIDAYVRQHADSAYHPSCTCKMGSPGSNDPGLVVDAATMKVVGLENLRIVDASIMPSVVSGNLNASVVMMAEKAADIIRGRPPLPRSHEPVWTPEAK